MNTSTPSLSRRAVVEFFGTFLLIVFATGVIISGSVSYLGISLAPALIVFVLILTVGYISGAHFNPAVSLAFLMMKKLSTRDFVVYVIAQLAGSALGALSLVGIFSKSKTDAVHSGVNSLSPTSTFFTGFLVEVGITLLFVFVILMATQMPNNSPQWAPFAIAITIFSLLMTFIPVTGACFNPARWFGPALISGHWENGALYIFAPMIGGVLSVFAFRYLSSGAGRNPA